MVPRIVALSAIALLSLTACAAAEEPPMVEEAVETAQEAPEVSQPEEPSVPQASAIFDTPWPSGFTRRELADTAIAKTWEFLDNRTVGAHETLLTSVHQDTVVIFHQELSDGLAEVTVDAFAPYLPDNVLLITGTNHEFLEETHAAQGRVFESDPFPRGGNVCVAWNGVAWVSMPTFMKIDALPVDKNLTACVPHELFHVAQDNLDKAVYGEEASQCQGDKSRPLWLVEGSAQFMGHAIVSHQGHHEYWGKHFTAGAADLKGPRPLLESREPWESGWEAYTWGSLATEYIIASVGIEPLMEIWAQAGQCIPFDEAFTTALGITVDDFYAAFDRMNEEMVRE
ncbi:MAG: hypothetical protein RL187_440 [Actinomycetota bacterium]